MFASLAIAQTVIVGLLGGGPECAQAAEKAKAQADAAARAPVFAAGRSFPVGPMAGRPVIADVNGDGAADIVVACGTCCGSAPDPTSGQVVILLNNGAGVFRNAEGSPIKVGPSVRKVAIGDVNGDGRPDIAAAEHDSHELTLLLGEGDGRFVPRTGAPIVTATSGKPHTHDVALADVNGDGSLDLLSTGVNAGVMAVLLNDGRGEFAAAAGSPMVVGRAPYDAIATGDLDGDGHIDVVLPSVGGNAVIALRGDGKGGFVHAPGSPIAVAPRPGYVAVGDWNGDGHLDACATHDDAGVVAVLMNDGAGKLAKGPGGTFAVEMEGFLWGIAPADFNRDGRIDLAMGNAAGTGIHVLLGDGFGGFAQGPGSPVAAGKGAGYVAAADLNNDGWADLVSGNYESGDLTILLAQPAREP